MDYFDESQVQERQRKALEALEGTTPKWEGPYSFDELIDMVQIEKPKSSGEPTNAPSDITEKGENDVVASGQKDAIQKDIEDIFDRHPMAKSLLADDSKSSYIQGEFENSQGERGNTEGAAQSSSRAHPEGHEVPPPLTPEELAEMRSMDRFYDPTLDTSGKMSKAEEDYINQLIAENEREVNEAIKNKAAGNNSQIPLEMSGISDHDYNQMSDESPAKAKDRVRAPTSLEEKFGSIKETTGSQQRMLVDGDSDVERRLYDLLERKGLGSRGRDGVFYADITQKKYESVLREAIDETAKARGEDIFMVKAARIDGEFTPRSSFLGGMVDRAANKLSDMVSNDKVANMLHLRSTVDVFIVGDKETVEKKLGELGALVGELADKGYLRNDSESLKRAGLEDGERLSSKSVQHHMEGFFSGGSVTEQEPLRVSGSERLGAMTALAVDKMADYAQDVRDRKEKRGEYQENTTDESIRNAQNAAIANNKEAPHADALDVASRVKTAMASPESLEAPVDKKGNHATEVLEGAWDLRKDMVSKLPDEARQDMLVSLKAIAEKAADGEYGDAAKRMVSDKESPGALSQKLEFWVAEEKLKNPDFDERAKANTEALVQKGFLTEDQASRTGFVERANTATAQNEGAAPTNAEVAAEKSSGAKVELATRTEAADSSSATSPSSSLAGNQGPTIDGVDTTGKKSAESVTTSSEPNRVEPRAESADNFRLEESRAKAEPSATSIIEPVRDLGRIEPRAELTENVRADESKPNVEAVSARVEPRAESADNFRVEDPRTKLEPALRADDLPAIPEKTSAAAPDKVSEVKTPEVTEKLSDKVAEVAPTEQSSSKSASLDNSKAPEAVEVRELKADIKEQRPEPTWEEKGYKMSPEQAVENVTSILEKPAYNLTKQNKSWDQEGLQTLVDSVAHFDTKAKTADTESDRQVIGKMAAFLDERIQNDKLPGLHKDSPLAERISEVAQELKPHVKPDIPTGNEDELNKQISKLEGVVNRVEELTRQRGGANVMLSDAFNKDEPQVVLKEVQSGKDRDFGDIDKGMQSPDKQGQETKGLDRELTSPDKQTAKDRDNADVGALNKQQSRERDRDF